MTDAPVPLVQKYARPAGTPTPLEIGDPASPVNTTPAGASARDRTAAVRRLATRSSNFVFIKKSSGGRARVQVTADLVRRGERVGHPCVHVRAPVAREIKRPVGLAEHALHLVV